MHCAILERLSNDMDCGCHLDRLCDLLCPERDLHMYRLHGRDGRALARVLRAISVCDQGSRGGDAAAILFSP